jgi:hypothetical protein
VKHDHGMRRCWLKGQTGDALHAVLCATGYNLRWLLRAIVRLGLRPIFFILAWLHWIVKVPSHPLLAHRECFRPLSLPAPTKVPSASCIKQTEFCRSDQLTSPMEEIDRLLRVESVSSPLQEATVRLLDAVYVSNLPHC